MRPTFLHSASWLQWPPCWGKVWALQFATVPSPPSYLHNIEAMSAATLQPELWFECPQPGSRKQGRLRGKCLTLETWSPGL